MPRPNNEIIITINKEQNWKRDVHTRENLSRKEREKSAEE